MKISYGGAKLKKLCEEKRTMERKLGAACSRKLRARLSDMDAANQVTDLKVGAPHPLTGDRKGQFAVSLAGGKRLVFVPDHSPVPTKEDSSINWGCVTRVRIIFIGDYHD